LSAAIGMGGGATGASFAAASPSGRPISGEPGGKAGAAAGVGAWVHVDGAFGLWAAANPATRHLVAGIEATVGKVLSDAGVRVDAVDTVFFTGGSSGVQLLRQKIAALLPSARRVEGDLFGSIGAGLALDAARHFG